MESQTRTKFPLSPLKIIKKTLTLTLAWNLLLLFLWGMLKLMSSYSETSFGSMGTFNLVILSLMVLITLPTYLYQRWYFETYYYELSKDYIIIKKNPITPREITIPYERVQDVYVDQDIFDRMFGLYDVYISSATVSSSMEAHIDGAEKAAAEGLRAELLQTVKERISKK